MKCITVQQPWATLAAAGLTKYILRDWRTSHRGPMAIQASRQFPRQNVELCCDEEMRGLLRGAGCDYVIQLPVHAVIGTVTLCDCIYVTTNNRGMFQADDPAVHFGVLQPGRWAWICSDARPFPKPIPMTGRLGVFKIPDDIGR
jgi:hypothetical protein